MHRPGLFRGDPSIGIPWLRHPAFFLMDDRMRIANRAISLLARVSMTADGIHEFFVDSSSGICYGDERHSLLRYIYIDELAVRVTEKEHPFFAVLF